MTKGSNSKKELATFGANCSIVACVMMLVLPITADGTGLFLYVLCQFVNSLGMGIYSTVSWSMMGDAVDYNEWKNGSKKSSLIEKIYSNKKGEPLDGSPVYVSYLITTLTDSRISLPFW